MLVQRMVYHHAVPTMQIIGGVLFVCGVLNTWAQLVSPLWSILAIVLGILLLLGLKKSV